jgi:hypothetical protein
MGFGPFLVKAKSGERDIGGGDGVRAQPRAIPAHLVSLESRRTNDPFAWMSAEDEALAEQAFMIAVETDALLIP